MFPVENLPVEAVIVSARCSIRTYYNNDTRVCHSYDGVAPASTSITLFVLTTSGAQELHPTANVEKAVQSTPI